MQYVSMGDVTLSRIVRGFWRLTGPKAGSWNISDEALKEMIAGCLERGITSFDTADIYGGGQCEVQLGRVLPTFGPVSRQKPRTMRDKVTSPIDTYCIIHPPFHGAVFL